MERNKMLCIILAALMIFSCMVGCGEKPTATVSVSNGATNTNYSPNNINDTTSDNILSPSNDNADIVNNDTGDSKNVTSTIAAEENPTPADNSEPPVNNPELPIEENDNPNELRNPEKTVENPTPPSTSPSISDETEHSYEYYHPQVIKNTWIDAEVTRTNSFAFSYVFDTTYEKDTIESTFDNIANRVLTTAKTFLSIDEESIISRKIFTDNEMPLFYQASIGFFDVPLKSDKNILCQIELMISCGDPSFSINYSFNTFNDNVAKEISENLKNYFGLIIDEQDIQRAMEALDKIERDENTTSTVVQKQVNQDGKHPDDIGFSIINNFDYYMFSINASGFSN